MGVLDGLMGGALKGVLGDVEAAAVPALISSVLAKTNLSDLQGLVTKLQEGGLATQVQSWLGDGKNIQITPDQLRSALGDTQIQDLARHLGLPVDAALKMLAEQVPNVVDQSSEGGALKG